MDNKELDLMYARLISEFRDTRVISKRIIPERTEKMISGVSVVVDGNDVEIDDTRDCDVRIDFIKSGTVNAAYDLAVDGKRVAMLDFADAKRAGGWPDYGVPTQEENICRCTNLYEALILQKCADGYYKPNDINHTDRHLVEAYTDRLIYVPNVTIIKDDETYAKHLYDMRYVDVIVSPAPCGPVENVRDVIYNRICGFLRVAISMGVDVLVLGAWGCGAFGQNPMVVAECFADALLAYPYIPHVVFAIRNTAWEDARYSVFESFKRSFNSRMLKQK